MEAVTGRVRPSARIAVLSYHKVGPPPVGGWDTWYYVPATTFEAQLAQLVDLGWQPIGPGALLAALEDPGSVGERSVLVTFDDGYRSLADHARPVLERADVPWVVFVPTGFIGRTNGFDEGLEPTEAICSWSDLRAWSRLGVSVQSHGVGHRSMSELLPEEQQSELLGSRLELERGLGTRVQLFAFPYGDAGGDPPGMGDRLRNAGYEAAFVYGGGPVDLRHADRYRLPRIAMGPDTDLAVLLE